MLNKSISDTGNVLRATTNCTTVKCLRNLTVDQILAVEQSMMSTSGTAGYPVIDGYVLGDILENYYASGNFQEVPIMVGSTANESSLGTCTMFNGTATSIQAEAYLSALYNATIIAQTPTIYGPISIYNNPLTYLNIINTDAWLHCGCRRIASSFFRYGSTSYLYTYNHILSGTSSCYGATHSAELPMLFPSYMPYFSPGYTFNAIDQQVSTNMMLYWAHFISSSNPNYNGSPANWDAYQSSIDNDLVIQFNPYMRDHYYYPTCSEFWDRYAVTNNTFTSIANTYTNKNQYFLLLFSFVCIHIHIILKFY